MEQWYEYPLTGRFLLGRLRDALSEEEKGLVESLVERVEEYEEPHHLVRRGVACDHSSILIDGFLLRTINENDRRFIVGLQVPGDFADLHCFPLKRLDHDLVTVGPTRVGYVAHRRLEEILEQRPHLARLMWFSTLLDAAIHRQWILKLQQLKAEQRAAHMLCEIWCRLDMVGLGEAHGYDTPLTQADLADMCGTTAIHMNRALGQLKKSGFAEFRRGRVIVPDRPALERHADFDSSYLYGKGVLAMGGG